MSHIFVSYSHKDQEYATQLAQTLEMEGYSAWIDNRGIDYGAHWPHIIQEALDSCVAFIVVMSPNSYQSEWVQNELSRAQRKQKPILPLLLDGDEPWLMVESKQYADVRGGKMPPKKFYDRLGEVAPRKRHDPQESGYFVFNLDSQAPEHVNAEPPPLRKKPRGTLRETGSHQQVNLKQTESGWFTPPQPQNQAQQAQPPRQPTPQRQPQYQAQQQHYGDYQQAHPPARHSTGTPSWKLWAGIGAVGFIGLIILIAVVASVVSKDGDDNGDSQADVAADFLKAFIEGDYSKARSLTSSSCAVLRSAIDEFEFSGTWLGTASNIDCQEDGTDTIFCSYAINGVSVHDTLIMDGNKVCSFVTQ